MVSLSEAVQSGKLEGNLLARQCPSRDILKHLTGRWAVLVLIALENRTLRFSELRRRVGGVSDRMLTQTLQTLEADGFVQRHARNIVPPHVEYNLSDMGVEATEHVRVLADWIEANTPRVLAHQAAKNPSVTAETG